MIYIIVHNISIINKRNYTSNVFDGAFGHLDKHFVFFFISIINKSNYTSQQEFGFSNQKPR